MAARVATLGRCLALLRTARACQTLQRSLTQQLMQHREERTLHCQCIRPSPGIRWYSESANKYTREYYDSLVKGKPLVLFMKGEPSAPMCGFSRLVVQILEMHGARDYEYHDVLEDIDFKEGIKEYSDWPTFPQVFMNGELVGGADIMLQMHQSGELISEFEQIGHRSLLADENT